MTAATQRLRDLMPETFCVEVDLPYVVVDDYGWVRVLQRVDGPCSYCRQLTVKFLDMADEPGPVYCSKQCARAAYRRRRTMRRQMGINVEFGSGVACPTRRKMAYSDLDSAERARVFRFTFDAGMHSYRCACGSWHIGHAQR